PSLCVCWCGSGARMQNPSTTPPAKATTPAGKKPRFPGIRITTNGNQLVAYHTEARITEGGVFYPITPSVARGANYQLAWAGGNPAVFGRSKSAGEAAGEHAA